MIFDNPYHILGLPADCTAPEFAARSSRVKAYLNVGKPLVFDEDLYFAGCRRNATTAENAMSALQNVRQKLRSGLFWFTRSGLLDSSALDLISKGEVAKAYELLSHVETRSTLSARYISSANNFGTLCLLMALTNQCPAGESRLQFVLKGLRMKAKIIGITAPEDFEAWCASISDEVTARDVDSIVQEFAAALHLFVDELRKYGVNMNVSSFAQALDAGGVRCAPLKKPFVSAARQKIELALRQCEAARKADVSAALRAGKKLAGVARKGLRQLSAFAENNHYIHASMADRAADELLNCGVSYCNDLMERDRLNRGHVAEIKQMVATAQSMACGALVKQRSDRNMEALSGIAQSMAERAAARSWLAGAAEAQKTQRSGCGAVFALAGMVSMFFALLFSL